MLVAYIDESGNTGDPTHGGSLTYTLGCVLIRDIDWPQGFDNLLAFRRQLKTTYGLPMRGEVKAQYLVRDGGPLRPLGLAPGQRFLIYRAHMRVLSSIPVRAFAVLEDKRARWTSKNACFDSAWEGLLQRLEHTSRDEGQPFLVMHDEGENDAIRKWVRRARRHLTAGSLYGVGQQRNPARLLVDDPVPRKSQQSYFVQLADLVAYAAFRSVIQPGLAVRKVCPQSMWQEIGGATHTVVNRRARRAAPGIVVRPP